MTSDAARAFGVPDATERAGESVAAAPTRRCGRCLVEYAIPDDAHPMELRGWWSCPACTTTLLPGREAATPATPTTTTTSSTTTPGGPA